MGTVTIKPMGRDYQVTYLAGKGKQQRQVYQEMVRGDDTAAMTLLVSNRLEELRTYLKREKFVPATK